MSSSSSSNITILNRTAFPLNVALSILAPFQHINALEPGDVWTTESPSFLPLPSNDNLPRRAVKALSPLLLSRSKWLKRLPIKPKVSIDIRFDHEHNRYSEEEAYHLWTSFSARWLGLIALSGAFVTIVSSQIIGIVSPSSSRRIPASCLALGIFGVLCLIVSFYGVYNPTQFPVQFSQFDTSTTERREACKDKDPALTEGRVLSATVPAHTLYRSAPPPSLSPRGHTNLAVLWIRGRFALWDLDLDQEIHAHFNGRR